MWEIYLARVEEVFMHMPKNKAPVPKKFTTDCLRHVGPSMA